MKKFIAVLCTIMLVGCSKQNEPAVETSPSTVEEETFEVAPTPYETLGEEELASIEESLENRTYPDPEGSPDGTLDDLISTKTVINDTEFTLGETNIDALKEVFGEPLSENNLGDTNDVMFDTEDMFVVTTINDGTIVGCALFINEYGSDNPVRNNLIPGWASKEEVMNTYGIEDDGDGYLRYNTEELSIALSYTKDGKIGSFQKMMDLNTVTRLIDDKGLEHKENPYEYVYPGEEYDPDREEVQDTKAW